MAELKTLKSLRLDKEFEVETCQAKVNPETTTVIYYSSLRKILNELEETINVTVDMFPNEPVIGAKATITDDTGASVVGVGSVNIEKEAHIGKCFPFETAYNRAISNALIYYLQFEEKCYSTVSIPPAEEEPKMETPQPYVPAKPVETKKVVQENKKEEIKKELERENLIPAPPKAFKPVPKVETKVEDNTYIIPFGKNQGKTFAEVSLGTVQWYASDEYKPTNEKGKELKERAIEFLEGGI